MVGRPGVDLKNGKIYGRNLWMALYSFYIIDQQSKEGVEGVSLPFAVKIFHFQYCVNKYA